MTPKHLDVNLLPVDTPLIMITANGDWLEDKGAKTLFVELDRAKDGMIIIRSIKDNGQSLNRTYDHECTFESASSYVLKFETKISSTGYVVFENFSSENALGIETQGREKVCVCNSKFCGTTQEWILLKPCQLDSWTPSMVPVLDLQRLAFSSSDSSRRELVVRLLESGKSSERVGRILKLLYGSTAPCGDNIRNDVANMERRQLIMRLVEAKKPIDEVGNSLMLLYGTKAPLCVRAGNQHRAKLEPNKASVASTQDEGLK